MPNSPQCWQLRQTVASSSAARLDGCLVIEPCKPPLATLVFFLHPIPHKLVFHYCFFFFMHVFEVSHQKRVMETPNPQIFFYLSEVTSGKEWMSKKLLGKAFVEVLKTGRLFPLVASFQFSITAGCLLDSCVYG